MSLRRRLVRRGALVVSTLLAALATALGTLVVGAGPGAAAPAAPAVEDRFGGPRAPRVFRGWGFDTCGAPSLRAMSAWRHSKYRAVGVYYGGRGRACKRQPHLSRGWMRATHRMGWRVLPIYVGSQPPCVTAAHKRRYAIGHRPWRQGRAEGRDAVRRARALGMRAGSPLYLDMEAYTVRKARCARTTLAFVQGWNRAVRRHGYLAGFYSSAASGVLHMERARRAGVRDLPSVMWFARWHTRPTLYRERSLSFGAWRPHRRIHQYAGNVQEKHGGYRLNIDRNLVDAPVAVLK